MSQNQACICFSVKVIASTLFCCSGYPMLTEFKVHFGLYNLSFKVLLQSGRRYLQQDLDFNNCEIHCLNDENACGSYTFRTKYLQFCFSLSSYPKKPELFLLYTFLKAWRLKSYAMGLSKYLYKREVANSALRSWCLEKYYSKRVSTLCWLLHTCCSRHHFYTVSCQHLPHVHFYSHLFDLYACIL